MILIDKLCYNSKLRYVNAGEKAAFSTITLCLCIISRSVLAALLILAVNGILTVKKGGIPLVRYGKLMLLPLAFLLLSTGAILVNISDTPMDAYAISLGEIYLTGSMASLQYGIQLILTALAGVSCLYFLALSTPITDIVMVLKKLHVPALIIELMILIYRFIFVLLDVAARITTAQYSRLGNRDFKTACRSFGQMASVLLVLSLKKSGALYDAMESRCYDGNIRVLTEDYPPKKKEILWIICFELILLLLMIWSK